MTYLIRDVSCKFRVVLVKLERKRILRKSIRTPGGFAEALKWDIRIPSDWRVSSSASCSLLSLPLTHYCSILFLDSGVLLVHLSVLLVWKSLGLFMIWHPVLSFEILIRLRINYIKVLW